MVSKAYAGQVDTMTAQHHPVVFDVLADFCDVRIGQDGPQAVQHVCQGNLFGSAQIVVPHRDVPGLTGGQAKGKPHQLRLHGILGGGFRIQGKSVGSFQAADQRIQAIRIHDSPVVPFDRLALRGIFLLQLPELQLPEEPGQGFVVRPLGSQTVRVEFNGRLPVDGHQFAAQQGLCLVLDQVLFLLLLGDGVDAGVNPIHTAKGFDQAHGGLLADAGNAGDVVRGVAGKAHHVDHLPGLQVKGLADGGRIDEPCLSWDPRWCNAR